MSDGESGRALIAFEISSDLRERIEAVIAEMRDAEKPKQHVAELVTVVLEMTDVGLDYYYLRPLGAIEAGFVLRNTAKVGLAAAKKSLPLLIRKVVSGLSDKQLLALTDVLEEMVFETE